MDLIFLFIIGLCVGSFLNVCIYRLPQNESIVLPRSYCRFCKKIIAWYDNIPVISYLILLGKCRSCKKVISWRYPLVEVLTAWLFVILYSQFGFNLLFWEYSFFFCLLIIVSFIDIDYHAIPAVLCFFGIIIGLVFSMIKSIYLFKGNFLEIGELPIVESLKGLVFGLGFAYLFKLFGDTSVYIYLSLTKKDSIEGEKEALGLGDVDFLGMVGVFLGAKSAVLVFFIAPFIACLYSLFALFFKRSHLIPYLPYLSLASLIVFYWSDKILSFFKLG